MTPIKRRKPGFLLHNVSGVLIQGFTVRSFHEADILLEGATGNVIRNNRTTRSAHDGIQLNSSSNNLIEDHVSFDNDAPLPARAFTDACGVLLRTGSSNNTIRRNEVFGNAFGILVSGGSNSNVVFGNDSHDNRRFGIRNRGNAGTLIRGNEVEHNVVSSLGPGRAISVEASTNVTVMNNQASDNTPDLFSRFCSCSSYPSWRSRRTYGARRRCWRVGAYGGWIPDGEWKAQLEARIAYLASQLDYWRKMRGDSPSSQYSAADVEPGDRVRGRGPVADGGAGRTGRRSPSRRRTRGPTGCRSMRSPGTSGREPKRSWSAYRSADPLYDAPAGGSVGASSRLGNPPPPTP